jgi:hypothetical protein
MSFENLVHELADNALPLTDGWLSTEEMEKCSKVYTRLHISRTSYLPELN